MAGAVNGEWYVVSSEFVEFVGFVELKNGDK